MCPSFPAAPGAPTPPHPTSAGSGGSPRRRTIALLSHYLSFITEGYEGRLRHALHTLCREHDINLLLFYGRAFEEPDPTCAAHNAIFDLVHPDRVDGVIALSSVLAACCGLHRLSEILQRYATMPFCSMGLRVPGLPGGGNESSRVRF